MVAKTEVSKPAAVETEAGDSSSAHVKWRKGIEFDVPLDRDEWSVETLLAFEDGKAASIVRAFMPPATFRQFMVMKPTGADLNEVMDLIAQAMGLKSAGE